MTGAWPALIFFYQPCFFKKFWKSGNSLILNIQHVLKYFRSCWLWYNFRTVLGVQRLNGKSGPTKTLPFDCVNVPTQLFLKVQLILSSGNFGSCQLPSEIFWPTPVQIHWTFNLMFYVCDVSSSHPNLHFRKVYWCFAIFLDI